MATFPASKVPPSPAPPSPWHSPVPYLFGGLAAMMGLIAFALLILACSYVKLSRYAENRDDREMDLEAGEEDSGARTAPPPPPPPPPPPVIEEKYLVIMAGQEKPTFLATPISSRASSFSSRSTVCSSSSENTALSEEDCEEKQIEMGNMKAHEATLDQVH
ncbi:hypothetical protein CDL12_26187 [Handroanthus impetiginosus]|uniref:Uncharacterized protein n=1 Tax=Handroanthus impetiginosus TaxID=429701 RepID=A0A2G9G7N2_9LAMI|nr:hypothetical protein CDL12_26187 [Handroanthus impetiginosus]